MVHLILESPHFTMAVRESEVLMMMSAWIASLPCPKVNLKKGHLRGTCTLNPKPLTPRGSSRNIVLEKDEPLL